MKDGIIINSNLMLRNGEVGQFVETLRHNLKPSTYKLPTIPLAPPIRYSICAGMVRLGFKRILDIKCSREIMLTQLS